MCTTNFRKNTLTIKSIKAQTVTEAPNLISPSEPPAPKLKVVNPKIRTDATVLSTETTGAILIPENRIPRKKRNIKSIVTLLPKKDPISNQDKNTLGTKQDQILPPHSPKFSPEYTSLIDEADDYRHEYTYTSRTDE